MYESKSTFHALVCEFRIKRTQLRSREHTFVDQCATTQRWEICLEFGRQFVLNPLTRHEDFAIKVNARRSLRILNKDLAEGRHHRTGTCAKRGRINGDLAPTEDRQTFFSHNFLN